MLNPYGLPAIIVCILSVFVGSYVFYKNPKNIQNRVFVLFTLFVIVFSIAEVMARFSNNSEEGLLWGRIGYSGVIFMPLTFLYISLVFPREKTTFLKNKYLLFGLYLIGFILLCIFNLVVSVQDVQWSEWGYRVTLSSKFYFIGVWLLINVFSFLCILLYKYKQSRTVIERKQIKYIFYGASITAILTGGSNVIPSLIGVEVFPLGTIGVLILTLFIGSAILKYNLFRFKPMIEPSTEEKKAGPKRYELEPSKSYITKEEWGEQGYKIFIDQITHNISGLCITKHPPQKIRDKYGLKTTPIVWFTFKQSDKETTVNPQKLGAELVPQIEDFVKKGKQTIVFMDCFDQITLVKGLNNTLTLISDVKNLCQENQSILLLSVNANMLEEEQLSFLEKEFLEVK